nr:hypothetical protein [Tanacetum cinerariifolium]
LLPHARGLGFKPRRGVFPSGAKKECGLSPKAKVRVLHTAQLDVTEAFEIEMVNSSEMLLQKHLRLERLLPHARGLGFKPRRGVFPSGAKKECGLSPKAKVRVLHTAQLELTGWDDTYVLPTCYEVEMAKWGHFDTGQVELTCLLFLEFGTRN